MDLKQYYSKCGPGPSISSINLEIVRNNLCSLNENLELFISVAYLEYPD